MTLLTRIALAFLLMVFAVAPAAAGQPTGSAAWTNDGWTNSQSPLYAGPGPRYEQVGAVEGGLKIRVDRCSQLWCQVRAGRQSGWMALANLSFGQGPWHLFDGRQRQPIRHGGPVCFYGGQGFTGREVCFNPGHVTVNLALVGLDNSFSSVKVGGGSVLACRDRNFRSYCVVINKDETRLDGFLDNGLSSLKVY